MFHATKTHSSDPADRSSCCQPCCRSGSTIFVYENGIKFTGDLADTAQLQYNPNNNVLNTIVVQDATNFELLAASVGRYTGSWDAVNRSGNKLGTVMIYYPELSIDIVLAKDDVSSV